MNTWKVPAEQRFAASVDRSGECHLWKGGHDGKGYGRIRVGGGRREYAHRYSFWREHGRWPEGHVLHSCDTPACVNPAHLREGTDADNMRDRDERGRGIRGERHPSAKLSYRIADEIRAEAVAGATRRALAAKFGVTKSGIDAIVSGRRWIRRPK